MMNFIMQEPGYSQHNELSGTTPVEYDTRKLDLSFSDDAGTIMDAPAELAATAPSRPLFLPEDDRTLSFSEPQQEEPLEVAQPMAPITEFQLTLQESPAILRQNCIHHIENILDPPDISPVPATDRDMHEASLVMRNKSMRDVFLGKLHQIRHNQGFPDAKTETARKAESIYKEIHADALYWRDYLESAVRVSLVSDSQFLTDINRYLDKLSRNEQPQEEQYSQLAEAFINRLLDIIEAQGFITDATNHEESVLFLKDFISLILTEDLGEGVKKILTQASFMVEDAKQLSKPLLERYKKRAEVKHKGAAATRLAELSDSENTTESDETQPINTNEKPEPTQAEIDSYLDELRNAYQGWGDLFRYAAQAIIYNWPEDKVRTALKAYYQQSGLNDQNVSGGIDQSVEGLLADANNFVQFFNLKDGANRSNLLRLVEKFS